MFLITGSILAPPVGSKSDVCIMLNQLPLSLIQPKYNHSDICCKISFFSCMVQFQGVDEEIRKASVSLLKEKANCDHLSYHPFLIVNCNAHLQTQNVMGLSK